MDLRDRYADLIRARYPNIPRRVSGYNLDDLLPEKGFHVARALAGTESTCVTYLEATVHLLHSPPVRSLVVIGYDSAASAADHVMDVLEHKPLGLEGVDEQLIVDMTMLGKHKEDLSKLPDGQRLAARRVRRRDQGGGRREGACADGRPGEVEGAAEGHEALRRPAGRAARLGGPRGRPRRDRVPARQARHVRGLGGLGGPARAPRRLPPRAREADGPVRLRERALRPLRPGLRPRALELRPRRRRKGSRPTGASSARPPISS